MGIDINKIIAEATQEETDSSNEVLNETATTQIEEKNSDEKKEPVTIIEGETPQMDTNHCMASAISAGLGAMTFRNHLRSLTEMSDTAKSRWKTAGKIGAGVAAAGAVGKLAYDHVKGNETESAVADNDAGSRTAAKVAGVNDAGLKDGRNLAKFEKDAKSKSMAAKLNKAHQGNPLNTQNKAIH